MKIITNSQPRDIISWYDLTEKEKKELDWAGETADFFRYKGWTYCCADFMRIPIDAVFLKTGRVIFQILSFRVSSLDTWIMGKV